ncbi:MAG: hypothetical protein K9G67_08985 [Bacteroidales bacterium]|nr:hypothetical protein [Bacteroidales bacterium]MCF8344561.1 hypothetical protein [Bacteroidales bacterium]MCF8350344.1 hypothetical protein [Bacteroidales bacterium]MCF8376476.1 hypothetical protein [Bacteroidales bacterium]
MKKDMLENFIRNHRTEFDDQIPSSDVWQSIQKDVRPVRRINWNSMLWKAAAMIVIFIGSYFFHDLVNQKSVKQTYMETEIDSEDLEKAEMLMEAEAYYTSQIDNRKQEVFRLAGSNRELVREVNMEFDDLDKALKELKQDMNDNASNEEVIEAMIQNYRIKLMILEEMLTQLKNTDNENETKEQNHGYEI